MGMIEERLRRQGISLDGADWTGNSTVEMRRSGNLLYLSAALTQMQGYAGGGASTEDVKCAGRALAIHVLGELSDMLGSLDRIQYVAHVLTLVRSAGSYTDMPNAANGFSAMLVEALGDAGRHARAAMGVAELEGGALMLAEVTLVLREDRYAV